MLSCKDFVKQQNQKIDGKEFSFAQRLSMKMHYFMCIYCRRYLKQLRVVNQLGKQLPQQPVSEEHICSSLDHIQQHQSDAEK